MIFNHLEDWGLMALLLTDHGCTLVDVIVDAGVSAKTLNRPGLTRALEALDGGEAEALLVVKLDRLTRSVRDLGLLIDRYFGDRGAALMSVAENVDTRTAAGRLVLNVLVSVAQWEREATAERTRDALSHLKAQGVKLGGEALGWTRGEAADADGRRIVEAVRGEARTVARILELREEGRSLRAIAERLTSEGHATKRGGRWQANTIRKVLKREGRP